MNKFFCVTVAAVLAASLWVNAAEDGAKPKVKLETTKGTIVIELYNQAAPRTVANFLQYVKDGHYNGTIFHRVIKGFMVQGGGFSKDMTEKATRPPVANEADNGLKNEVGTIAMARTGDPHSATAQFFINTVNNTGLNFRSKDAEGWGYCVFGKVVGGMSTVTAIENVPTGDKGMFQNVPITPVEITKALVVEATPAAKDTAANAKKGVAPSKVTSSSQVTGKDTVAKKAAVKATDTVTTASGLKYIVIKKGNGVKPKSGAAIKVHYTGKFLDGKVFDSSVQRNEPFSFAVGTGQVIKGWDEGLLLMSKGEKCVFIIPPQLGYGAGGTGPIPPNSTLIFEVELIDF
jgi:peptidyl-prolyl cis-trans isomerase B (cyclophilin B)